MLRNTAGAHSVLRNITSAALRAAKQGAGTLRSTSRTAQFRLFDALPWLELAAKAVLPV
ncbi:hypothetical protein [Paenibacillus sp. FSL L8-0463]|uniref:hypothetical protein n=1 Tax=Paenibacillus sp. FSL L8-0463 TaxID=2954687 RepID=UPI00311971FA